MKGCVWLLPILLAGCAGRQSGAPAIGTTRDLPVEQEREQQKPEKPISKLDPGVVERAALPFFGLRTRDDARLPPDQLLRELSEVDVVCVGEDHDNPHHHWAQLRILRGLIARAPMRGRQIGLGLEMIQRPYQEALDAYLAWEIDEKQLVEQVEWHDRWGYDWAFYRPVIELGRSERLPILALNAPRELTQKISRQGLEGLDDDEREELPELDTDDPAHRSWFDNATRHHPPPVASRDSMYLAQVLWDETMAETSASWLTGRLPVRQLLVLAGAGHCQDAAVPSRVRRRVQARVASVRPVVQASTAAPTQSLVGFDYAFVMTPEP
jgi:uncharacterized iron-regulated protein